MKRAEHALIEKLTDQYIQNAPTESLIGLIGRAEQLMAEIDPAGSYYEAQLCEHLSAEDSIADANRLVQGKRALVQLRELVERVSDELDMSVDSVGEPVLTVSEVGERFNVSTKTVDRWRSRGLSGRNLRFGSRKRIGFLQSAVDRFASNHAEEVNRGSRFRQLSDRERDEIIEHARPMAAEGFSPSKVARRLAKRFDRSPETVRYTLRDHDRENSAHAVFPQRSSRLDERQKEEMLRKFHAGMSLDQLADRFNRSKATVTRIVNQQRAKQLLETPIEFMDSDEFRKRGIEKKILGPPPETPKRNKPRKAPAGIPPYLASLYQVPLLSKDQEVYYFRKMNYLKYKAARMVERLDADRPKMQDLDEIEQLLHDASRVRNLLIRRNLRLVVSVAKKFLRPGMSFFELVSDGNVSLMRAIDRFDYTRGFKLSTYATWAIRKNFARSIPAEHVHRDRYRTGTDEMFRDSADERTSLFQQERTNLRQREILKDVLGQLNDRERNILVTRFGLVRGEEPQTLEQVGDRLGVTKERIRQLEKRALGKMRDIADREKLDIPGI